MPERPDIDVRGVRIGALAILGGILFAVGVSWWLLRLVGPAANTPSRTIDSPAGPGAPRLQPAPQPDRAAYTAEKARLLSGYGWVDRQAGIARIPLDEAMRLLAARGGAAGPAGIARPAAPDAATDTMDAARAHDRPGAARKEEAR